MYNVGYSSLGKGVSERMVISDLEAFASEQDKYILPIMKNLSLNYNKVTSLAIAGNSGSGKSYALTYFLSLLKISQNLSLLTLSLIPPHAGHVRMALL